MKSVYILCEGQTEERFVNDILSDFFSTKNICLIPIIIATKRTVNRKDKGGITSYGQIKRDLNILCRQHPHERITTMIDYYRLPEDTPGINSRKSLLYEKVEDIEKSIFTDINCANLTCYLNTHEFEALLFAEPDAFEIVANKQAVRNLHDVKGRFKSAEHINNSPLTAPSKRIENEVPNYSKVLHGVTIASKIGLTKMRRECRHFNDWIEKMLAM